MDRISVLISAFGVLAGSVLLISAVREYQAGSSVLWAVGRGLGLPRRVPRSRAGRTASAGLQRQSSGRGMTAEGSS
ncbi:hypothetical protein [Streptomyces sp. ISL-10]|uniref:hypothetical protein n=1 Tax=Streptomyces sp. ISL-10 TaxID=2819172 RepID=UPI002035C54A|nr:hypothetical protein [Streptomyces sp. ISL-10]